MSEPSSGALLRCRGLTRAYGSAAARVTVLNGLDVDVERGDMVAILGESGVENAMMPLLIAGEPKAAARRQAADLLGELGLSAALDRRPAELSGGEQQRVAIARAVVRRPALLLADEPTGNLDERNAAAAIALLRDLHRSRGMTTLLVTHSERLAAQCDRILVMERGSLTPRSAGR